MLSGDLNALIGLVGGHMISTKFCEYIHIYMYCTMNLQTTYAHETYACTHDIVGITEACMYAL